ncbi:MAG: right-handed parallel beta-helix repeat-containing protein [Lachnospiraceae bacterium]|nr:right-handed parallel beta-helix repeat-containing protein [Lachnospiraceae bacterium]
MKQYSIECTAGFEKRLNEILETQKENAEIHFAPGVYEVTESFRLGKENRNITFLADGEVRFVGGRVLKNWKSAAGLPEAERLTPEARGHVVVCEVEKEGLKGLLGFTSRGFGRQMSVGHSELFADGEPLSLAQYPKEAKYPKGDEFTCISGVPKGNVDEWKLECGELADGFYCEDPRLKEWQIDENIWVLGYWRFDWANSYERIQSYNPEDGMLHMAPPYGNYGYMKGQRLRFYNILEEVREPGDYYLDLEQNRIFLYPKEGVRELTVSANREPFFLLEGCEDITFEGLQFEGVCGCAVEAVFTERLHIDNCIFRNIGNYAVDVMEGHDPLIENSTIHDCGDGGIMIFGGNRCTLEPMNARLLNNHIYNIAKWSKCYQTAMMVKGVGIEVRHNLIHDCPHIAILYTGNDIRIEDNEFYRVVMETGDAGAVYSGNNYTFRGNSVSHNYIHHLGGVGFGTMGIYNDDRLSGTKMCNNYLEELTRGVMLGGGRDLLVKNNVFVKCDPAISFDSRGADNHPAWRRDMQMFAKQRVYRVERYTDPLTERQKKLVEEHRGEWVNAMDSEYIKRYPEIAKIDEYFRYQRGTTIDIPGEATVENNIFISKLKFRYTYDEHTKKIYDRGVEVPATRMMRAYVNDFSRDILRTISGTIGELHLISNYPAKPEDFEDPDWSDLRVKRGSEAERYGYIDGDFESIGLQECKRRVNPARVNMTVQFVPGQETARIGMRNRKDTPVSGLLLFKVSKDVKLAVDEIPFELAGGEEKFYEVSVLEAGEDAAIEAYSNVPGVRPARA